MSAALILYGSRARGEADSSSDVDLILAEPGSGLRRPHISHGVSVHWYSQDWLTCEARSGNLFVYHVAFEGVPLLDPQSFLTTLRRVFSMKPDYRDEANEAAAVLKLAMSQRWDNSEQIRRRFFWALRTLLIAEAADRGRPVYSAHSLEGVAEVLGVEQLIKRRLEASQEECNEIGAAVLSNCNVADLQRMDEQELRCAMIAQGGMAADSVRLIEEGEIVMARANAPYF